METVLIILTTPVILYCAMGLVVMLCGVCWWLWEDTIRWRLIPHSEIRRLADELRAAHDDPLRVAQNKMIHAYHFRCSGYEAGIWQRVCNLLKSEQGDRT